MRDVGVPVPLTKVFKGFSLDLLADRKANVLFFPFGSMLVVVLLRRLPRRGGDGACHRSLDTRSEGNRRRLFAPRSTAAFRRVVADAPKWHTQILALLLGRLFQRGTQRIAGVGRGVGGFALQVGRSAAVAGAGGGSLKGKTDGAEGGRDAVADFGKGRFLLFAILGQISISSAHVGGSPVGQGIGGQLALKEVQLLLHPPLLALHRRCDGRLLLVLVPQQLRLVLRLLFVLLRFLQFDGQLYIALLQLCEFLEPLFRGHLRSILDEVLVEINDRLFSIGGGKVKQRIPLGHIGAVSGRIVII
mmetsp:Transcript_10528/g.17204  ORF Transcript_10528/g.17204 Transcript_10528/m.17204 type:complete len:303 (+) Transcript_10528:454-1362(+)